MIKETRLSRSRKVLLALLGVVLLGPVVDAQTNVYPQLNDLILGFRATGDPGKTLNLEVDLGPMSQFYTATPGQTFPLPGLSVLDLSATYGSNWITRTDLFWGAIATTGRNFGTPDGHAPTKTLWATAPVTPDGVTPWNRASTFAQQGASATIEAMFSAGPGALYGAVSTVNSTNAAVITNGLANSWGTLDTKNGISFGYFSPTIDNFMWTNVVVSQLYELQPTNTAGVAGALLGNLILTASGLSFQAISPFGAWQMRYFGCMVCAEAAADADPLGKGMSNTNQFLAGLNPTNAASVFQITAIARTLTNVTVAWKTAGVRTNVLQGSTGTSTGGYTNNFTDISGGIILNVVGDTATNYVDQSGTNRFYRIRLSQ